MATLFVKAQLYMLKNSTYRLGMGGAFLFVKNK